MEPIGKILNITNTHAPQFSFMKKAGFSVVYGMGNRIRPYWVHNAYIYCAWLNVTYSMKNSHSRLSESRRLYYVNIEWKECCRSPSHRIDHQCYSASSFSFLLFSLFHSFASQFGRRVNVVHERPFAEFYRTPE